MYRKTPTHHHGWLVLGEFALALLLELFPWRGYVFVFCEIAAVVSFGWVLLKTKTAFIGLHHPAASIEAKSSFNKFPTETTMNQGGDSSHLSFQLTSHKLNGTNYLERAQFVHLAIDGRGKLWHLTGETRKPELGDPKMNAWRSENSMVIAWLLNSIEPAIGKPYLFLPTAKDVWEAVRETYSDVENVSQIFK